MSASTPIIPVRTTFKPILRVAECLIGGAIASAGWWITSDPIGRAMWGVACVVLLLPISYSAESESIRTIARSRVDGLAYTLASGAAVLMVALMSGFHAAFVVAAIAISLIGGLLLLARIGVPTALGIGWLLVQSVLFLAWPIWAANLLVKFDSQSLVDLLVKVGPIFAINGSIDPTDAFTHRPLAYRLMNLGQDIPYEMPRTIWPCVLVHLAAGLPGMVVSWRWKRPVVTQTK